MNNIIYAIIIWNVLITVVYAIDKWKAMKRKWRISEMSLILSAFFFGSVGAMLGMILFNHKTSKIKFRLLIPLAFLFNIAIMYFLGKFQIR